MIDHDIHLARALLVENNVLLRSVAAEQLRNAGVGQVVQVSRVKDARLWIERERFDIIVCNREFEGTDDSGQDLLDELRRENQLPYSTVFLMVTSQAAYHQVVEAAEAVLDGLLLRPYAGAALGQRLAEARHRKRVLADILLAQDSGQTELALTLALRRYKDKLPYAAYCGRLVAELLLTLQRPLEARAIFDKLALGTHSTWPRLGAARSLLAAGEVRNARYLIESVLLDDADAADAHDLLGGLLVEQCDFEGALVAYRRATALTPGCLLRNQHAGALAFYQGYGPEALTRLERAVTLGVKSKLFDALTLVLIGILRFDAGDTTGLGSLREQLRHHAKRQAQSPRLQRFGEAIDALTDLLAGRPDQALEATRKLAAQGGEDDFDLEAASTVLLLWDRLPPSHQPAAERDALAQTLGMRFCTSNAVAEVLLASVRRANPVADIVRTCQSRVGSLAEQAMEQALRGQARAAVLMLLQTGEQLRNAKLLEMAALLARRNADSLGDAEALITRATDTITRSCPSPSRIAGIRRSGRAPSGLQLRLRNLPQPDTRSEQLGLAG